MKLTITKELCEKYDYKDGKNCPLFHAAKEAGLNVITVGCFTLAVKDGGTMSIRPGFTSEQYHQVWDTGEPFECEVFYV